MAVLAAAAGLAHVPVLDLLHRLADGLPVGDLGLAHVGVNPELAQHAVHQHFEVELAHAADDCLARLLVGVDLEGGVLLRQCLQGTRELVLVGLRLRLYGDVDDGLGEVQRLQDDGVARVAQGIAGGRLLQPHQGDDVAGVGHVARLAVVGVHLYDAADALFAVTARIEHGVALADHPGVDTGEDELAQVLVSHDLEGQGGERFFVVSPALEVPLTFQVLARGRRYVERAGQVIDDSVQHGLHALVFEGGAAQHGNGQIGDGRPA